MYAVRSVNILDHKLDNTKEIKFCNEHPLINSEYVNALAQFSEHKAT
jgi:hypothetical protein